jgi:hypothetical protein
VLDPETLTADDLSDAVETVHSDSYHDVVASFQTTLREAGGAERVADAIERFDGQPDTVGRHYVPPYFPRASEKERTTGIMSSTHSSGRHKTGKNGDQEP